MPTFDSRAYIDRIIAGNGWSAPPIGYDGRPYDQLDPSTWEPDNMPVVKIVQYTNAWGGTAYGCVLYGDAAPDALARFQDLVVTHAPGMVNMGSIFAFGQWLDPETFNVAMQTLFVETEDRGKVLTIVGNIRTEGVSTMDDDGVTQAVVMSAGVKLGKRVGVPNPVTLKPYRTFREIDQPESKFVLRVKGEVNQEPRVALFEADGGFWKVEAIESIADFLRPLVPTEVVIIA